MKTRILVTALLFAFIIPSSAALVMGENKDQLPTKCDSISSWQNITINAGREYAEQFNGKAFTYDNRTLQFEKCTKLTVTFVNNDSVRHQWMIHGLPWNRYPKGMFTLEVTGPGKETGTLILPAHDETYKVHCGLPQHAQKGMKAQIKVGEGDGKVANIPGYTDAYNEYQYEKKSFWKPGIILGASALGIGILTSILVLSSGIISRTQSKNSKG
jgi:plastocyanin